MEKDKLEELLTQCQALADEGYWRKIIDILEALPEEEQCPETDNELARAYNSVSYFDEDGNELEDESIDQEQAQINAKKAVSLLKPHEEYFKGDHCWNYRLADAYYTLEQNGRALTYFNKALEGRPGDRDTNWYIGQCTKSLEAPIFRKSFQERTRDAWDTFVKVEEELRQWIDKPNREENGREILSLCHEVLDRAFYYVSFEVGLSTERKYELILSAEGKRGILFELVYFKAHAPESVLEHWNIVVEVVAMNSISDYHVLESPKEEPGILLSDLPGYLENLGIPTSLTAEKYLENLTTYTSEANSDPSAFWRADIYEGSTRNCNLINNYLEDKNDLMDDYQENGVVAGFFAYSLQRFSKGEGREKELVDFRDSIKKEIEEKAGEDALTLIGEATGLYCGYLDFLAWGDIMDIIYVAKEVFENSSVERAAFCTFRRGMSAISIKDSEAS